jgi:hypothetical protein
MASSSSNNNDSNNNNNKKAIVLCLSVYVTNQDLKKSFITERQKSEMSPCQKYFQRHVNGAQGREMKFTPCFKQNI